VWGVLTDVGTLTDWVGIMHSVTEVSRLEKYTAVLQDNVGPFELKANLDISVAVEAEERRIAVSAAGRDRAVNSKISIDATLELDDTADGATITVNGNYQVTGRVAAMGGGIIHKKAEQILEDFFRNMSRSLNLIRAITSLRRWINDHHMASWICICSPRLWPTTICTESIPD
jgi:carbon monoxide dehydrogenase subunit G